MFWAAHKFASMVAQVSTKPALFIKFIFMVLLKLCCKSSPESSLDGNNLVETEQHSG